MNSDFIQYDLSRMNVRLIGTDGELTQINYDNLPSVLCKMNLIRAITYISHLRQGVSPIIEMRLEKKLS